MEHPPLQQLQAQVPICPRWPKAFLYCKAALPSSLWRTLRWELRTWLATHQKSMILRKRPTFNDCIHRATLLTKSAINTFRHINIVSRSPPTPILSFLGLNRNSARRADSLAQLAGNAPLFPCRITPQSMLPAKPRRYWALLERIVDGIWRPKELL